MGQFCSLSIILSLSKDCGPSLKPHLPLYVGSLLDAIGEGEHQLVNYIAVRASADELEVVRILSDHMHTILLDSLTDRRRSSSGGRWFANDASPARHLGVDRRRRAGRLDARVGRSIACHLEFAHPNSKQPVYRETLSASSPGHDRQ